MRRLEDDENYDDDNGINDYGLRLRQRFTKGYITEF